MLDNSDSLKPSYKKLLNGIGDIRDAAEKETKFVPLFFIFYFFLDVKLPLRAIEEALEQVGILLALRQAPEVALQGKLLIFFKRESLSMPKSLVIQKNG